MIVAKDIVERNAIFGAVVSIGQPDGTWHVYFSDDDLPKEIKATIEKVYLDEDG